MSFALYGTPTPDTLFSAESFHDITIADADRIIQGGQLPHILPKGSLRAWVFDREVPTSLEELTVSANEHIPCAEDMLPITCEMESAFHRGARSVCLNLPNGSVRYHLSKIRLIINVNNHAANLAAAASLLNHVESSFLLLPDRIQELKGNKFMEPLAGFHVTAIPLYTLGCLLNERWAKEDVLNARAELTYFHRAVIKDLGQDPSFLFIPTSFINDCRTLIKLPGSPYSQNIIWFRERVRSGSVNVIGFLSWTRDHYSALVKMRVDDLEHGDSLNLPPESDLLPLLRWALAGLRDFEPRADQTYIPSGLIDRQTSLAGEGSCGIAAANFIEFRIGMDIPRWMADQSGGPTTQYSDWVMPCFLSGNGEVPGFTSTDVGVGYCDFNLDMPSPDMTHPIFDWVTERLKQPQIFPEIAYSELQAKAGTASLASPFKLNSSTRNTIPSITQLAELPLDHAFNFPAISFGHSPRSPPKTPPPQPRNNIIVIPDTPSPAPPPPKTPPRRKIKDEDVMDLCSPDVIDLSLSTPPRLATKAEVIELTSPFQPGVKRKHEGRLPGAKVERIDIDLSSPPRRRTKQDSSLSSRLPPPQAPVQRQQPPRIIELGFGPIQLHNVYDTFETAEQAIYQAQEALGHKWIRGQVRRDDNTGAVRRRTLRCNRYREPKETHRIDIDPSDHRRGKSGRTNCLAHVNLCPLPGGQWQISLIDAAHNHEPHVPSGGQAGHEPSNQARSEARQEVNRLGGDVQAILASLETLSQSEPGWAYSVQMDTNGVVTALWWQSPEQAQLTGRYTDILINDNSYNRNDKQYPLSIGIIVDSHGRSRNAWYAFQKKEDTESFAWILRCHLRATGDIHPELFVSDRSGALIAAVVLVLIFTFHIYCLSHLLENVDRNLGRVLGDAWRSFLPDFWACYRAVSPEDFETQWQALVQRYPAARSYLTDLYECRDRWAWAWISVRFTAGIRTNGRVEVENRITKTITGPGKTLFQVFNALNERTQEQKRDENIRVRDASRKQHPGQTERAFQPILDMLREHVGAKWGLPLFYNASALQLPHGVRDWSEYAIALNDSEPGFVWDRNEEQSSRNDFANDNAYIGTRFLLRLLYWSEDRLTLADQPDVYLEFPRFLEDVVKWVADRRTRQTNRASNAMTLVRTSSDIFAGAGVYTITELWHMAGLSPNLTEAEVFDSPSRTARLCGAFYHFAKEAHTTLWTLVQRFLVDYVICVRKENRLLYSERLQVYGKERSYVSARFHGLLVNFKAVCEVHSRDPLWVRRCTAAGPFDVFEPELIRHALEFEDINLGGLIFGEELWAKLHSDAGLPIACLSSDNTLARFYSNLSIAPEMSTSWLNPTAYTYLFHANKGALRASHPLTILYRAANTDIWSVIPAFPDNSAPIPRARPPQVPKSEQIGDLVAPATWKSGKPPKPKTVAPLVPKTTPMQQCNPSTRDRALLAYIIKFTQNFTVGPLDYCGIARRIKGRGDDM
ncbi:hypothetical protein MVEN_00055800 [Mycena venus]|uniref:MULE transposase domain-containing protein n=1 Tax=Mycena venus TaxID=2733690 RepID=A0A8H6Z449_9AGAR|nr:hypothetical protein MVEN_00055800 [Mycena venus]